jgi:hypothetical protein
MSSHPWTVGPWELHADLAKIEEQWTAIRRVLEDEKLLRLSVPDVSAWGCGQHAGHSVLVARTIADRVLGTLAEPDRARDETTFELARRVLSAGRFRRGVAEAPPDVRPESHSREDLLLRLPEARSAWGRVHERADELPGCAGRDRHFSLGYLTSVEWVRMCAVHTAHHLQIVRDIAGEGVFDANGDPE